MVSAEAIAERITPATKLLVLNTPCNPTGAVVPPKELAAIAAVVAQHKRLLVLSDEIYERLVYDGAQHASFAALDPVIMERTVTINGLSKSYAMTGWRLGYAAAARPVAQALGNFLSQTTSNVTSIAQKAAVAALRHADADVARMLAEFARRRTYVLQRLQAMPHVHCAAPGGAFYVFPNVQACIGRTTARGTLLADVNTLGLALLEEAGLAVVPGDGFGSPSHVRISYAASPASLDQGCDRLEGFLRGLR